MKHLIHGLIATLWLVGFSALGQTNLQSLDNFGQNPGELTASYYLADDSPNTVVLLHGCTQNAETFAQHSGFLTLAKQHQFNLLLPQQSAKNNIKTCFNWFSKQDISKDEGELLSLRNMILAIKQQTNSENIYVAGLSAGGAMTSTLLSIYPELFTAGAIIAGISYPCADTLTKAIACMRAGPTKSPAQLADAVRDKHSEDNIRWPHLSVWTGTEDKVVNLKNAKVIAEQWLQLKFGDHRSKISAKVTDNNRYKRSIWNNAFGQAEVELYEVNGLDHGIMVNPNQNNGGTEGPFLLKSVVSAAVNIIDFWQLEQK